MNVTPKELAEKLNCLSGELDQILERSSLILANDLVGNMSQRIHQEGKNSANEKMFYRSTQYKRLRERLGFRTDVKDLEREGDLRRALQAVNIGDSVGVRIVGDENRQIADYQEEIEGEEVWRPTDSELDKAITKFERSFQDGTKQCVK